MKKFLSIFFCLLLLFSCNPDTNDLAIYREKVEGTSKVLYYYEGFIGNNDYEGYTISGSNEKFKFPENQNWDFLYLEKVPYGDTLFGVNWDGDPNDPKHVHEMRVKNMNDQGISIQIKIFDIAACPVMLRGDYIFTSFKETRDSIYFYNLKDTITIYQERVDSLKFKKINVRIDQSKDKIVSLITIDDLKVNEKDNKFSDSTYFLRPIKKIKSDEFSDYGIFKEVQ